MKTIQFKILAIIASSLVSCATIKRIVPNSNKPNNISTSTLALHSIVEIPHDLAFEGTTIGGLSGIDYDSKNDIFYVISDDRSEHQPSRYYSMRLSNLNGDTPTVNWLTTHTLKNNTGKTFPNMQTYDSLRALGKRPKFGVLDPESIRYHPKSKMLYWTTEGERLINDKDTILAHTTVHASDLDGRIVHTFQTPKYAQSSIVKNGIQRNKGYEGLSITPDGKHIFVGIEGTLLQDIPSDLSQSEYIRIAKYDVEYRGLKAAYAYPLEKVLIDSQYYSYSIAEVLAIDDSNLVVIERIYHKSMNYQNDVKLYLATINQHTTNTMQIKSLQDPKKKWKPMSKQLLLDMKSLPVPIDNIEGITFGPKIDNKKSLVLVSDNNFNPKQQSIIYILTY